MLLLVSAALIVVSRLVGLLCWPLLISEPVDHCTPIRTAIPTTIIGILSHLHLESKEPT